MYKILLTTALILTLNIADKAHAQGTTPCDILDVLLKAQKVNLELRFSNKESKAEVQQKKMALGALEEAEEAVTKKDQSQCTMKMLVIKQILEMTPASQIEQ